MRIILGWVFEILVGWPNPQMARYYGMGFGAFFIGVVLAPPVAR